MNLLYVRHEFNFQGAQELLIDMINHGGIYTNENPSGTICSPKSK